MTRRRVVWTCFGGEPSTPAAALQTEVVRRARLGYVMSGGMWVRKARTSVEWAGSAVEYPAEIVVSAGTRLRLHVAAHYFSDPAPPHSGGGGLDQLWDYEVVELFLAYRNRADGLRYLEVELGPHGHWVCLAFDGVRRARCCPLPLHAAAEIVGDRWTGVFELPGDWAHGACAYNVCAIHGEGDARRYDTAVRLAGEAPDFHQPQLFRPIG